MHSQLALIHRLHADGVQTPIDHSGFVAWSTCLRTIQVGELSELKPTVLGIHDEIFRGRDAYVFLLEVVCGMKSPILGETEVHGQYREFLEKNRGMLSKDLYRLLHQVHVHAKQIRALHLQGLGSQSYGSYCRRKLRGSKEINILGAGHLTQEILPWLNKLSMPIRLHVRAKNERVLALQAKYPRIRIESFEAPESEITGGVVVAAPLTSAQILNWLGNHQVSTVLDLRGESAQDPIQLNAHYEVTLECLKDIFSTIENSRVFIKSEIAKAQEAVLQRAEQLNEDSNSSTKKRSCEASGLHRGSCAVKV